MNHRWGVAFIGNTTADIMIWTGKELVQTTQACYHQLVPGITILLYPLTDHLNGIKIKTESPSVESVVKLPLLHRLGHELNA